MGKLLDYEHEFEDQTRQRVQERGYRLMHRRNGQYWLMVDQPLTLAEINNGIDKMPVIEGVR